jgi:ABC-type transport system involved in cytochrome bd biosynthesis fused ATPase/permease subunit
VTVVPVPLVVVMVTIMIVIVMVVMIVVVIMIIVMSMMFVVVIMPMIVMIVFASKRGYREQRGSYYRANQRKLAKHPVLHFANLPSGHKPM